VVLSDFWSRSSEISTMLAQLSATARTARWCRSSIRRKRPSPIPAASSSSSRKAAAEITAGRAENWARRLRRARRAHRDEIRAETDKLGWSFSIHRTDRRPPNCCCAACAAWVNKGARAAATARQSGAQRMIAGLPLGFAAAAGAARPA
jgi:hypothetical protein